MTSRELALSIIRRLRRQGHEALLAGGCVRDRLLRRRPKDYDIATSARPAEVEALFPRTLAVGARFGVIVVLEGPARVEVATFRADAAYADGRHPTGVTFTSAREDGRRRDFTINALFYDPIRREVIDHVGGQRDLERGLIRAVGDPRERFREDHLRMLRAVRFAARLGFRVAPKTARAIRELAPLVARTSGERIRYELAVMLCEPTRADAVRLADRLGLLEVILPEVVATKGCRQGKRAHPEGDVWKHTLKCLEALRRPDLVTVLATLLHDIGKPPTADYSDGKITFYRHSQVGAEMSREASRRLRLSADERDGIAWVIRHHLDLSRFREMRPATLKRLFDHPHFAALAEVYRADLLGSCTSPRDYHALMRRYRELAAEQLRPEPLVRGHDVLGMGLAPGPAVGQVLREVYDEQLDGTVRSRDEALALARRLVEEKKSTTGRRKG